MLCGACTKCKPGIGQLRNGGQPNFLSFCHALPSGPLALGMYIFPKWLGPPFMLRRVFALSTPTGTSFGVGKPLIGQCDSPELAAPKVHAHHGLWACN